MLPWGTPERTGSIAELQPFIETCWTLFVRYSRIHSQTLPVIPIFQIFESSSWWGTVSKAGSCNSLYKPSRYINSPAATSEDFSGGLNGVYNYPGI